MNFTTRIKNLPLKEPPVQAIGVALAGLVFMGANAMLVRAGMYDPDVLFPWSVTAAFLLFFALLNSLMSLKHENFGQYWGKSMYSYMALALVLGVCAWGITGKTVGEAGSYKWIIFVVTFGFLVFLSMVNFMKRIVRFAEREEWNQPRRRR